MAEAAKLIEPPWEAFPHLPRGSIGWRMGGGEAHYNLVYRMYSALSDAEREQYEQWFPEPPSWAGWYAMIRGHPWI